MGRPPVQHHKHVHVLSLSPELEEMMDKYRDAWVTSKGIKAGGEALKGAISHPIGFIAVGALLAALVAKYMPQLDGLIRAATKESQRRSITGEPEGKSGLEQMLEKYLGGDWGPGG